MKKYTIDEIQKLWGSEKYILVDNKKYIVKRMSYGDYFTEPITWKGGEKDGFSPDCKWFEKVFITNQYGIKQLFYQLE